MRRLLPALCCSALACATPGDPALRALLEQHRAQARLSALVSWAAFTRGEEPYAPPGLLPGSPAMDRALLAGERGRSRPAREALALSFLGRALAREELGRATAPFDAQLRRLETSRSVLGVPYRDVAAALAAEPLRAPRLALDEALSALLDAEVNPLLAARDEAARAAAPGGYLELSSALRGANLRALASEAEEVLGQTEASYLDLLDACARDELGLSHARLRAADLPRLWKAPSLAALFPRELLRTALAELLSGMGLDLRTAAGSEVLIDDEARPAKRQRAFVTPVDAPRDVRLSVKPAGGLDDYATLFHEAGHAVHFAAATVEPAELVALGYLAPTEAYGELFRGALADPRFLERWARALVAHGLRAPSPEQLAAVARRQTLWSLFALRREAAIASYELALRQGDESEAALRERYRALLSRAQGFELTWAEAARYRTDVDDLFHGADYLRAFALSAQLERALRGRFGDGFRQDSRTGRLLRTLFAEGESLTAEQVSARVGGPTRISLAAAGQEAAARLSRAARALLARTPASSPASPAADSREAPEAAASRREPGTPTALSLGPARAAAGPLPGPGRSAPDQAPSARRAIAVVSPDLTQHL